MHLQHRLLSERTENRDRHASIGLHRFADSAGRDGELPRCAGRWVRWRLFPALLASIWLTLSLCGCVANLSQSHQSSTAAGSLQISPGDIPFGTVSIGQTASKAVSVVNPGTAPVQVTSIAVSGRSFSVSGAEDVPVTLAAGASYNLDVNFTPTGTGKATGTLTVSSNSQSSDAVTVDLSGSGASSTAPVLSGLSCADGSLKGPGTDECGVTVSSAAGSGGVTVALASSNSAVKVPGSVKVAAGATKASFAASVNAVSTAQSALLTASAGGVSQSVDLELDAAVADLSASTTSLAFGNVNVNTMASQQVTLTASGNTPVTISSVTVAGSGFAVSGASTPQTLNPNQSMTLTVQFDPAVSGKATGQLAIASNATNNETVTVSLSGDGTILILPGVRSVACANNSITGPATDACTVSLNGAAPTDGMNISLQSSAAAISVPASVQLPGGASSAGFTATATAVTSAETVVLTATSGASSATLDLQLGATVPTLGVSATSLAFGSIAVNSTSSESVTLSSKGTTYVTVNSATVSGSGYSASGASFPLALSPGQSVILTVQFAPTATGAAAGTLTLSSDSSTGSSTVVSLNGSGVPRLSGLNCASSSMSGAGTDNCTVALNAAAASGGFAVSLASNNSGVTVPASVTVAGGATSASFTANVASVSASQTATLTASAGNVTETFALQLGAAGQLNVSATSLNFGSVILNTPTTQSVTLSTPSTSPISVTAATVAGSGFSLAGGNVAVSLTASQSATFSVQFDPTALGASSGTLTIASASLTSPVTVVSLSGTGVASAYEVNLTWDPPASSADPVAGYDVYRSADGGGSYQELNSSPLTQPAYTDSNVQDGVVYTYYVESADASGVQSSPSNLLVVTIP
ncbi:MAG: choice-of-anchor D domain-containing protein [Terracidiphilus sp.]